MTPCEPLSRLGEPAWSATLQQAQLVFAGAIDRDRALYEHLNHWVAS